MIPSHPLLPNQCTSSSLLRAGSVALPQVSDRFLAVAYEPLALLAAPKVAMSASSFMPQQQPACEDVGDRDRITQPPLPEIGRSTLLAAFVYSCATPLTTVPSTTH